jgi:hypothetical protein
VGQNTWLSGTLRNIEFVNRDIPSRDGPLIMAADSLMEIYCQKAFRGHLEK